MLRPSHCLIIAQSIIPVTSCFPDNIFMLFCNTLTEKKKRSIEKWEFTAPFPEIQCQLSNLVDFLVIMCFISLILLEPILV